MKKSIIALVILTIVVLATPSFASGTTEAAHGKEIQAKVASFTSEALGSDPAIMKGIAKALGSQQGILSAKLDQETDALNIVFDSSKGSIEAIEKALGTQLKDFKRTELKDTKWAPKDCGHCPSASKCADKDKK